MQIDAHFLRWRLRACRSQCRFPSLIALLPLKIQFFTSVQLLNREDESMKPCRQIFVLVLDRGKQQFCKSDRTSCAGLRVRNWCGRTGSTRFSEVMLPYGLTQYSLLRLAENHRKKYRHSAAKYRETRTVAFSSRHQKE